MPARWNPIFHKFLCIAVIAMVFHGVFHARADVEEDRAGESSDGGENASPPISGTINPYVNLKAGGHLYYHAVNDFGDRIVDFGGAGYRNQGVAMLPSQDSVPVVQKVTDGGDIQEAINKAAMLPIGKNGFRGVVEVETGTYAPFRISSSGIIVRGKGDAKVIYRGNDTAIKIGGGEDSEEPDEEETAPDLESGATDSGTRITSHRVPTGSRSFTVENASAYRRGDLIHVVTTPNETWIRDLGMHKENWKLVHLRKAALRTITAIDGNEINIDEPTTITIWDRHGGGQIQKATREAISHVGLENIAIQGTSPKGFAVAKAIGINGVDDAFVRNVSVSGFQKSAVWVNRNARRVTLDGIRYRGAGETGGSQRYGFQVGGEQIFCHELTTYAARHAFVPNHQSVGGTVFIKCKSMQSIFESGGHRHWSGSVLWDNCNVSDNKLTARKYVGPNINHGWRAVNNVSWNTHARRGQIIFQRPPHAYNLVVKACEELPSLYEAQAKDRAGNIQFREYVLGDYDNFEGNKNERVDRVPVDPAWMKKYTPAKGFDDNRPGQLTPFTFTFALNPGEKIVDAQLIVRMNLSGDLSSKSISFDDAPPIPFHKLGQQAMLARKDNVRMFDLLEHLRLLSDGQLHVAVNDRDACVDYALLRLKVSTQGVIQHFDANPSHR